ncbi:MAG: hypothetical protein LBT10_04825 [Methanobrevibacter sp.]|jgi:hypothetical protein|nr:hypothetical protein [Methanobrevibacter sp.]
MTLRIINNEKYIESADESFFYFLLLYFPEIKNKRVDYRIYHDNKCKLLFSTPSIYYSKKSSIWFSRTEVLNRFVYIFGKRNDNEDISDSEHFLVLDFDKENVEKSETVAKFAKDEKNQINILVKSDYLKFRDKDLKKELTSLNKEDIINYYENNESVYLNLGIFYQINDNLIININKVLEEIKSIFSRKESFINLTKIEETQEQEKLEQEKLIKIEEKHEQKKLEQEIEKLENKSKCEVCGIELPENYSICKKCSRKTYAIKILKKLLNHIDPEKEFKKEDLKSLDLNMIQIQDYIWTLIEHDLINENKKQNTYSLKNNKDLNQFIEENTTKALNEKENPIINNNPTKKINKECPLCSENLPISKFYESDKTEDGFSKFCKECSKKVNAVKYLKKLMNIVNIDEKFSLESIKKHYDTFELNSNIWTLQDNDLIKLNHANSEYIFASENKINEFLSKYNDNYKKEEKCINNLRNSKSSENDKSNTKISDEYFEEEIDESKRNNRTKYSELKNNDSEIVDEDKIVEVEERRNLIIINPNYSLFNPEIMLKGIINNKSLFNVLNSIQEFSNFLVRIITNRYNSDYFEILIELKLNKDVFKNAVKKFKENGWKD